VRDLFSFITGQNILALVITILLALAWLKFIQWAVSRGWLSSRVSRKVIHMGTGPLFVLCWLFFNNTPSARYLAALVPFAITSYYFLVGMGLVRGDAVIRSISRTGSRKEILQGPLYYGIVFVFLTLLYWTDNPIGIVALMLLCGGDGLADLIGARYGTLRLPWNDRKSWAGSLAMFFGGLLFAGVILAVFVYAGIFAGPYWEYVPRLAVIAFAGTVLESLPFPDVDNITVTLAALTFGHILL
jgi:phytol kinase